MGYGSRMGENGSAITEGYSSIPVMTGERVEGCVLVSFGMAVNKEGVVSENRAEIVFKQPNGATFRHSYFDSDNPFLQDKVNTSVLHICTKVVDEETYYQAVENSLGFSDFIDNVSKLLSDNEAIGKKFNLKVVLKLNTKDGKYRPSLPFIPAFIEKGGTSASESRFKTDPKYDLYEAPVDEVSEEEKEAMGAAGSSSAGDDDLLF